MTIDSGRNSEKKQTGRRPDRPVRNARSRVENQEWCGRGRRRAAGSCRVPEEEGRGPGEQNRGNEEFSQGDHQ